MGSSDDARERDCYKEDVGNMRLVPRHEEGGRKFYYAPAAWEKLLIATVEEIKKLSTAKGGEYAGDDDRLANFRRNANALGLNMEDVWAVYAGKHWDAIQQYVKDLRTGKERTRLESISGRADDLIVYLILFKAMVEERGN